MSCCGKKRTSAASQFRTVQTAVAVPSPAATVSGPYRPEFEYQGGGVLTVVGQGSGLQYRFVGYGSRISVDPRDRASLAHIPKLRQLPPRR